MNPWEMYGAPPEAPVEQAKMPWEMFTPEKAQGNDMGSGKAFGIAVSGGQIPFANRLTSAIGAGIAKAASPITGDERSFGDLYDQAQADTRATQEANPGATLAGNVAGIASTLPIGITKAISGAVPTQGIRGAVNAIPQGLAKIDNFVRGGKAAKDASLLAKSGSLALRSAKGAAVAAPVGALYGAGDSEDMLEGAKRGAGLAAAVGGALPVAGAGLGYLAEGTGNVIKGFKSRDVAALEDAGQAIKNSSSKAYEAMRNAGATFKPQTTQKIVSNIQGKLQADGPLNRGLHGKTMSVISDLQKAAKQPNFDLQTLDQWRQLLGQVASNVTPDNLQDARKASLAIDALDDIVEGIGQGDLIKGDASAIQALQLGRQEYARSRKFNSIVDIVRKSDGDANYLKRELKKFADSPKKMRGFTASEVMAIKDAAKLSGGEGVLKMIGKFGIDLGNSRIGNTALPVVASLTAGATSGAGAGVALPIAGTAARVGQKAIARGKVETLLKAIEAGAPVSQKQIMSLPPQQAKALLQAMRPRSSFTKASVLEQSR